MHAAIHDVYCCNLTPCMEMLTPEQEDQLVRMKVQRTDYGTEQVW